MLAEPDSAIPFRPQIQEALDRGGNVMTMEDLYALVLIGDMQVWIDENSCAIIFTEVVSYPRVKAIRGVVSAGNLNGIKTMIPEIVRWGVSQGCERVELIGRYGWKRALGDKWRVVADFCVAECKDIAA